MFACFDSRMLHKNDYIELACTLKRPKTKSNSSQNGQKPRISFSGR